MYIRIALGSVPNFFTSKCSFSSGVGYVIYVDSIPKFYTAR